MIFVYSPLRIKQVPNIKITGINKALLDSAIYKQQLSLYE